MKLLFNLLFYSCTDMVFQWIKSCLPRTTIIFITTFLLNKKERKNNSYWKEVGHLTCFDIFNIVFLLLLKPWWTSCQHYSYSVSWVMFFSTIFLETFIWYVFNTYKEKKHALRTLYFVPIMSLSGIMLNCRD